MSRLKTFIFAAIVETAIWAWVYLNNFGCRIDLDRPAFWENSKPSSFAGDNTTAS